MSQKKVDAYKAKKGQHGRVDKKERTLFVLEMCAWAFICVTIVGWIGYSAYVKVTGSQEAVVQNTVMDTTALDNYISGLSTDTTEDADAENTEDADTEETDTADADSTDGDSAEEATDETDKAADDAEESDTAEEAEADDTAADSEK